MTLYNIPLHGRIVLVSSIPLREIIKDSLGEWTGFERFIKYAAIKRSHEIISDESSISQLCIQYFSEFRNELSLGILPDAFEKMAQLLRVYKKQNMKSPDKALYKRLYKPLEAFPDQLTAVMNRDLDKVEEELKKCFFKYVERAAKYYIISPYSEVGLEFKEIEAIDE